MDLKKVQLFLLTSVCMELSVCLLKGKVTAARRWCLKQQIVWWMSLLLWASLGPLIAMGLPSYPSTMGIPLSAKCCLRLAFSSHQFLSDAKSVNSKINFWFIIFRPQNRNLKDKRRLEWERIRRQELLSRRNREQEEIVRLSSKRKSLHLELEALVCL